MFDTLNVFPKEFLEKDDFLKYQQTTCVQRKRAGKYVLLHYSGLAGVDWFMV